MPASLSFDLLDLGVQPSGVLLVHASLRSLGPLPGGAETVIQSLLEALGPRGTLLLPGLSYRAVTPRNPVFDVRATPTCVGALPEYFRTRPGTLRSVHPTHSVCGVGARAAELLSDHQLDTTPVGPHSPFAKLPQVGGQILFIGCGLRPNTFMHSVEERVVPPYLFGDSVDYRIILADGRETTMRVTSHNFRSTIQRYDRLEEVMCHGLRKGCVGQAECYLLDAAEAESAALARLRANPLYFVDQVKEEAQ